MTPQAAAHSLGYVERISRYLKQNGPNKSSAPELTHLTPAQSRRAHKKVRHQKQQALRRKATREVTP